jgi:amidohydrolase
VLEHLIRFRHELHAFPELSGHERETAKRVEHFLLNLNPDHVLTGLGGHGIIATFDSGKPGPALLFRAELDALPIQEVNTFDHRSKHLGVSHKCGHDGHTIILCGLAEALAKRRPAKGKVYLLFQPAEETGEGAKAVLDDPKFAVIKPDMGISLHNFTGLKKNLILLKEGIFTIAVGSHIFCFTGYTSHASEPERGRNPSLAIAEMLQKSQELNVSDVDRDDFRLITSIFTRIGSPAYGVSAGDGEVHFTLRAVNNQRLEVLRLELISLAEGLAARDQLTLSHESLQTFYANNNDPHVTELVRSTAHELGLEVIEGKQIIKGGEDFGLFSSRFPCCMFGLGSGEDTPPVHSPDYDFPDDIIETGIKMFEGVMRRVLG